LQQNRLRENAAGTNSYHPTILTKEVFCRQPRQNAHFRKNTFFRPPKLNKIFILFNNVWTSKCPLSIGHFIESRHTVA
jgi:hypothetical protein